MKGYSHFVCEMIAPTKLVLIVSISLVLGACASSPATESGIDVTGTWSGKCTNCLATDIVLKLSQQGDEVTGTIAAAGRHPFGVSERPILGGKLAGNRLTFQAKGDPGDFCSFDVSVDPDGTAMTGTGDYGGSFDLHFTRASQ